MPVGYVLEVAELGVVRAVPRARPELLGIRNLRGQILPVADLALLLGITRTTPAGRLLVAEAGGHQVGFAIDEVTAVGPLPDPAEETESGLLIGTTLSEGDLIGVIDVPRVFDSLAGRRRGAAPSGTPRIRQEMPLLRKVAARCVFVARRVRRLTGLRGPPGRPNGSGVISNGFALRRRWVGSLRRLDQRHRRHTGQR